MFPHFCDHQLADLILRDSPHRLHILTDYRLPGVLLNNTEIGMAVSDRLIPHDQFADFVENLHAVVVESFGKLGL
jgi:hypothetical protein